MTTPQFYTREEELANILTHGLALILSVVGLIVLLLLGTRQKGWLHLASCGLYGATLVTMYAASTLYHGVRRLPLKRRLRLADHCAIYLLIAGTYTPFTLINLRGAWGWTLCALIWLMAVSGTAFRVWVGYRFPVIATAYYLAMGWLAVVAVKPMLALIPVGGVAWIAAGGLFYTVGVIFFAWRGLRYHHAFWHLCVVAGSVCHYLAVVFYVLPVEV